VNNRISLGDLGYTWDSNKIKTSESITGVMSGYGFTSAGTTYDNEDRLTGFSRAATSGPALLSQSWNLTAVGDWTSITTNGTAQSRTHGPTHELLTTGGQNVATDVKGNITILPVNLRPAGATTAMNLNWDSDNKLRSADIDANGTADVNFQYDALGRRVARSGTGGSVVYVQMEQQTIADYPVGGAATTPTFRYVYASYIDEPVVRKTAGTGGKLVCFHRNHQYSVTAVTTSTGAIAERYAYTAYGQPTILDASASVLSSSAINNRYTYTAREWDATLGLQHFRARWMSPNAGRFLGRDPIGYAGSPDDLYEFLESRTLFFTDPLGKIVGIPGRMICCGGTTIWSGPGATEGCCGNKVYRKMTECCDATGPLIHTKRNQAQCCAAAKAAGLHLVGGVPSGGGVICCDGKEVSCSWQPATIDPQSTQFINECTLKHEDDHHGAQSCSSQCPGLARNQMPPYWPWHWEECHAYRIEWHCLKVKQSLCSTVQCRIDIGARMAQIRVYAHATYGGCDVTSSL
jgi:RHS repeat-associated protein